MAVIVAWLEVSLPKNAGRPVRDTLPVFSFKGALKIPHKLLLVVCLPHDGLKEFFSNVK
jgi:hypothetical protein